MTDFSVQQGQDPEELSENDSKHALDLSQRKEIGLSDLLRWIRRKLAWTGQTFRRHIWFFLIMLGGGWGVIFESLRVRSWRRTVRYEFVSTTNSIIRRGLFSTMFTGVLTGIAAVSQVIYWLGLTGLATMTGSILINIVVREIAPILVGVLLLGRNGMLSTTELGLLAMNGEVRSMQAMGIDPFLLLVMPRTLAFTVGGFTLGILFSFAALITGYIISRVSGVITASVWTFFNNVTSAISPSDYVAIPLKFIAVGFVVGLGACLTGLTATNQDTLRSILPRSFSRGMLIVMVVSVVFSLDL
ncbi:MAG: ABC transporter permease [Acetobacter sp.]|nr:ABC transporter permease [Acetobacter sp.]